MPGFLPLPHRYTHPPYIHRRTIPQGFHVNPTKTLEEAGAKEDDERLPAECLYATVWYLGLVMGDRDRLDADGNPRPSATKMELDLERPVRIN